MRLGAIAPLVAWCLAIAAPFLGIVVWTLIIVIALDEHFAVLCRRLGGRCILAAVLAAGLGLLLVFGPAVYLSDAMVSGAQQPAHDLEGRTLAGPPPAQEIRDVPILGPIVYDAWQHASENLADTVSRLRPQPKAASAWLAAFVVNGIPGAGLCALLVLIAAVVQVPVALVLAIPVAIGFATLGTTAAVVLTIWCAVVGLVGNVLKPILFGRGAKVPALVLFLSAIGGLLSMGIVGLFLGSVVLALGFERFMAWLLQDGDAPPTEGAVA